MLGGCEKESERQEQAKQWSAGREGVKEGRSEERSEGRTEKQMSFSKNGRQGVKKERRNGGDIVLLSLLMAGKPQPKVSEVFSFTSLVTLCTR